MITVYSKPACPQCDATKRKLDAMGITYRTVDLTEDTEALALVMSWGFASAPVVDADGERWAGFRPDLIAALK